MDSKNDRDRQKRADDVLRKFTSANCYTNSCKAFSEYVGIVYDEWSKSNPFKRFKSKSKGRSQMVNAVREFQRNKLDLFEALWEFYHGLANTSDKYLENLGGKTAVQEVANGIRVMMRGYKGQVWKGLNNFIESNCNMLWGEKYGPRMYKWLLESTGKKGIARLLWPSAMAFWKPDKRFGIPDTDQPSGILTNYEKWKKDLEKNMEEDNDGEKSKKALNTFMKKSESLMKAINKHNEEIEKSEKEDKNTESKMEEKMTSSVNIGPGLKIVISEKDVDESLLGENVKEETVKNELEEIGVPEFLYGTNCGFGIVSTADAAKAVKYYELKEQDATRKRLDDALGKAGFWN